MLEAALEVKPAFLYDPMREIETYRTTGSQPAWHCDLLRGHRRCWGRTLRVVPRKGARLELYQVGDFATWRRVAEWLAIMHAHFAEETRRLARTAPLLRYDGDFYRLWADRARSSLDRAGLRLSRDARRGMEQLFEAYDRVIGQLVALPVTFLHGEFYASNVLVQEEGEGLARVPGRLGDGAVGPGLIDLAASPPAGGPGRTKGRRWPSPITPRWCPARIGRRRRMRLARRLTTAGCTSLCNGWAGLRVGRRRPSRPRTGWARRCSWPRSWDWREPPARRRTGNAHLAATTGRAQP